MQLKKYIPQFILNSKTFQVNYDVQQTEIDAFNNAIEDLVNQCFVNKATWGLKLWEEFLGIPTDESKNINYRRTVIIAKIRGAGTVTVEMMKTVANSFNNGQVDVIEDNPHYSFTIKFIDTRGIPSNLDDLKNAIENIKPAHLTVYYTFTYTTWGEVKNINWTTVNTDNWGNLRTRKVI